MLTILTNTYHIHELPVTAGQRVELDMGCGRGSFTLALAQRYPERLILGSDIVIGRLHAVQHRAERLHLTNLQLLRASSLELVSFQLPPQSIDRIHLLCPDPWPKKRQITKRLVNSEFLHRVTRILKPGGIFHASTDHTPYFEEWLRLFGQLDFFEPAPDGAFDVSDIKTDFERTWNAQGKDVHHACWRLCGTIVP